MSWEALECHATPRPVAATDPQPLGEYHARAVRNFVERHLLLRAQECAQCLVSRGRRVRETGWIWDEVALLDDLVISEVRHD